MCLPVKWTKISSQVVTGNQLLPFGIAAHDLKPFYTFTVAYFILHYFHSGT